MPNVYCVYQISTICSTSFVLQTNQPDFYKPLLKLLKVKKKARLMKHQLLSCRMLTVYPHYQLLCLSQGSVDGTECILWWKAWSVSTETESLNLSAPDCQTSLDKSLLWMRYKHGWQWRDKRNITNSLMAATGPITSYWYHKEHNGQLAKADNRTAEIIKTYNLLHTKSFYLSCILFSMAFSLVNGLWWLIDLVLRKIASSPRSLLSLFLMRVDN